MPTTIFIAGVVAAFIAVGNAEQPLRRSMALFAGIVVVLAVAVWV